MIWDIEDLPKIDIEKATKKYIKSELMNYYLYLSKYYELNYKKYALFHKSIGGSVIPMPDGSCVNDSAQHRAVMRQSEVEMLQQPYIDKMEMIDKWTSVLTKSQFDVVKIYVMKYQCENIHEASLEAKYEEDTINKYTKRAVDRIYSRIKNIL